jgi:hypothetical protein
MLALFKNGVFEKKLDVAGSAPKELSDVLHQLHNWPDSDRIANDAARLIKAQYAHTPLVKFAAVLYGSGDIKAVQFEKAASQRRGANFSEVTDSYHAAFETGEICMEFNRGWRIDENGEFVRYDNQYGGIMFVNSQGLDVARLW